MKINYPLFTDISRTVLFYIVGALYFILIKYFNFSGISSSIFDFPGDISRQIADTVLGGALMGGMIGGLEFLVSPNLLQSVRPKWHLLSKVLLYGLILFIAPFLTSIVSHVLNADASIVQAVSETYTFVLSYEFVSLLIHFCFISLVFNLYRQALARFGPKELWNALLGKYHRPYEEERIFMFLDLKSSTSIAEKLGHVKFSKLLQDVFHDLTESVITYKAEVYQYVGDEVVLTWTANEGLQNANCVQLFFDFEKRLQGRADKYRAEFGMVPEFKASLNMGKVTVTEVGDIKKEIAYHGDVLNTGARIQELCNTYDKKLLVSEYLEQSIKGANSIKTELINSIILKGKANPLNIYTFSRISVSA